MPLSNGLLLTALLQLLLRIDTRGLQQPVSRHSRRRRRRNQRLRNQALQRADDQSFVQHAVARNELRTFERKRADEDGQAPQNELLSCRQKSITPVEQRV